MSAHHFGISLTGVGMSGAFGPGAESRPTATRAVAQSATQPGGRQQLPEPILLRQALQDLIASRRLKRDEYLDAGLYLALPEPSRPGWYGTEAFLECWFRNGRPKPAFLQTFAAGHVAGLLALRAALSALSSQQVPRAIVAGVDSQLHPACCAWLNEQGFLKLDANSAGRVPGQEASAVLLEPDSLVRSHNIRPLAVPGSVYVAQEAEFEKAQPSSGRALAEVVEQALDGMPTTGWVLCDLNGERLRAREWGLVTVRLRAAMSGIRQVWRPADTRGDLGAATATSLLAIGARALCRGYAPAESCLLWSASDHGQRAATFLTSHVTGHARRNTKRHGRGGHDAAIRWM